LLYALHITCISVGHFALYYFWLFCFVLILFTILWLIITAAAAAATTMPKTGSWNTFRQCLSVKTRNSDSVSSYSLMMWRTCCRRCCFCCCCCCHGWTKRVHRPLFLSVICAGHRRDAGWPAACCWPFTLHCLAASVPPRETIWSMF